MISQQEKSKLTYVSLCSADVACIRAYGKTYEHVLKASSVVLWGKAKVYYKKMVSSPSMLKKMLLIEFSGEGADAGALLFGLGRM